MYYYVMYQLCTKVSLCQLCAFSIIHLKYKKEKVSLHTWVSSIFQVFILLCLRLSSSFCNLYHTCCCFCCIYIKFHNMRVYDRIFWMNIKFQTINIASCLNLQYSTQHIHSKWLYNHIILDDDKMDKYHTPNMW